MVGDWGYWVICEWVANTAVIIYNWIGLDWIGGSRGLMRIFIAASSIVRACDFTREFGRLLRIQKFAGVPFLSLRRTTGQDAIIQKTKTPRNNSCSHCCVFFLEHFFASHKPFTNMYLTRSEYDRGVNTFSPEGRLFQVSSVFCLFSLARSQASPWAISHALSSLF